MKMKYSLLVIIIFLICLVVKVNAQILPVGTTDFSTGAAYSPAIALNNNATPYVAFRDSTQGGKLSVMKYDGSAWVLVGPAGISAGDIILTASIIIDKIGTPYVVYVDITHGHMTKVIKYDGAAWVDVGSGYISAAGGGVSYVTTDTAGVPYIVVEDSSAAYPINLSVLKYDGSSWVFVGARGFPNATAIHPKLIFDKRNVPYLFYQDESIYQFKVKKFADTGWALVATADFFLVGDHSPAYGLDSNSNPYIAYADSSAYYNITVKKFNGLAWVTVGSKGLGDDVSRSIDMAFDKRDNIYLSYSDRGSSYKAVLQKWNGTTWSKLGYSSGFSPGIAYTTRLAIDTDGNAFIAIQDGGPGAANKASVYKCNANTLVPSVSLTTKNLTAYPNPCAGSFTLKAQTNCSYTIVNETGQIVKAGELNANNNHATNIKSLRTGVYFLLSGNESQIIAVQ